MADDTNYEINVHRGAGHHENRAFDIPVPNNSKEGDAVADYWRSKGYTVIWRSHGHFDHVHVEVPKEKAPEWFKIVKTAEVLSIKNGEQGIIKDNKWEPKKWSKEEETRYQKNSQIIQNKKNITDSKSNKSKERRSQKIPKNNRPSAKSKPNALQRTWSNLKSGFKKLTGFKRGGFIGNYSSAPSGYASYENYGGAVIIAIQPVMVQKEVMIDNSIPIPFPMSSGVNNVSNFRG
jgi:hypothetical protein